MNLRLKSQLLSGRSTGMPRSEGQLACQLDSPVFQGGNIPKGDPSLDSWESKVNSRS
jgi:hypothetical protein